VAGHSPTPTGPSSLTRRNRLKMAGDSSAPVHVKTLRSQKLRMLLTHRKQLQSKAIAIENDLRGTLRNFGLKVGMVGRMKFEARIEELVEDLPDLAVLVEPLLGVRRVLREQIAVLAAC
jgi:transposase